MNLYLIQHGKAKTEEEDIKKPLNSAGVEQTRIVAEKFIEKNIEKPSTIFYSKKLRAKQTAEILAGIINPIKGVIEEDYLNPNDDPFIWLNKINEITENAMIVGHLPHLKKLCSLLVFNNPDNESINFVNSGIICLKKTEGKWELIDTILPD